MADLEPYFVEFEDNGIMKPKLYPQDCQVGENDRRPIICITHDECTFSANDAKTKIWQTAGETPLRPKRKGWDIMVSDFFLLFGWFSLSYLSHNQQDFLMAITGLSESEAVEIFEYGKNNDGYWDGPKFLKQVTNKTIPIAEALYPGYSFLFMFDNATSYAVYAENALCVGNINKSSGGKQALLRNGWFESNGIPCSQPMSYFTQDGTLIPKGIQQVLEERHLWPKSRLNLECFKPKCHHCQSIVDCKNCVKGSQCQGCKISVIHSAFCSKTPKCDACVQRKASCQCVAKQYCTKCALKKEKCMDCEELSPRCTSEGTI